MKAKLLLCFFAGLLSSQAQFFSPIMLPVATNSPAATNAVFWNSNPPPVSIMGWQQTQALNEDLRRLSNALNALPDTSTNAVVNSLKVVTYTTNGLRIPHAGYVSLWNVTNFAGMEFTTLQGTPLLQCSFDGGVNWSPLNNTTITNTSFKLGFTTQTNVAALDNPIDAVITNVVVYTLGRPDLFGKTNAAYGQSFRVGPPQMPDEVANKDYVDRLFQISAWWSAPSDVQLNGHTMNWSPVWSTTTANSTTNMDVWHLSYLGIDAVTVKQPVATKVGGASIALAQDGFGTNLVVTVPTNGLTAAPRLQVSRYLTTQTWSWMTNSPTLSGTNYVFTFPTPFTDSGFFMALVPSTTPGAVLLSGVLQLTPRTVTNSTDSTFSYGAGLVSVDGSYLYVSTGTNVWRRVALSSW